MNEHFEIRKALPRDDEAIWQIIQEVISTGDTYVFAPDSTREEMLDYWCGQDKHTYVAEVDGKVLDKIAFLQKVSAADQGSSISFKWQRGEAVRTDALMVGALKRRSSEADETR